MSDHPTAAAFTSAPLRNRVRLALHAPVSEVWALLGDLARFPEYSSGLERVEAKTDAEGRCTEYICHFKPLAESSDSIVSREIIRWWEPQQGYASGGTGGDSFGLTDDLHQVTLAPAPEGTTMTWEEYFNAQDAEMMKAHFDAALADIAENLVRRFGGKLIERYIEPAR